MPLPLNVSVVAGSVAWRFHNSSKTTLWIWQPWKKRIDTVIGPTKKSARLTSIWGKWCTSGDSMRIRPKSMCKWLWPSDDAIAFHWVGNFHADRFNAIDRVVAIHQFPSCRLYERNHKHEQNTFVACCLDSIQWNVRGFLTSIYLPKFSITNGFFHPVNETLIFLTTWPI